MALRKYKEEVEASGTESSLPALARAQEQLMDEVRALRKGAGPDQDQLEERNAELEKTVLKLQNAVPEDQRVSKKRIEFLEKTIQDLEEQRSELLVRCTVAEEQLTQLQANTKSIIAEYQRKIVELKRR